MPNWKPLASRQGDCAEARRRPDAVILCAAFPLAPPETAPVHCYSAPCRNRPLRLGSTKMCGVKRRNRPPSEHRTDTQGRCLDARPSMPDTLTPRILILPLKDNRDLRRDMREDMREMRRDLSARLDGLDERLRAVETGLAELRGRLDGMDGQFAFLRDYITGETVRGRRPREADADGGRLAWREQGRSASPVASRNVWPPIPPGSCAAGLLSRRLPGPPRPWRALWRSRPFAPTPSPSSPACRTHPRPGRGRKGRHRSRASAG